MSRSVVQSILNNSTRKNRPLNILSFPTHERYQENLSKTGHNFFLWQGEGIKPWVENYADVPKGTVLLNPEKASEQIPLNIDIDLVLSQNKFGQFNIAKQISEQLMVPLISLEHTLPMETWGNYEIHHLRQMQGDVNVFISDYSLKKWGWSEEDALVIHYGVDTDLFSPQDKIKREPKVLSVVNDWINRDWCCGFNLWCETTGYPNSELPIDVVGDTPGLSEASKSTQDLINKYSSSRVFLNTSLISPVPTSLLEAMSCGCAVVSTNNCMIPEIIENGKNGYMSNNPNELRSYVQKLLDNEELAEQIGKNARETVISNFGLKSFVSRWENLFLACTE